MTLACVYVEKKIRMVNMGQLASTDYLYGSPDAWIQNTGFHNIPVACISTCYFPCLLSQLVLGTFPQFSTRYILMPLWSLAQTRQATTAVKPRSMFPALLHLEALEDKCVSLLFSSGLCGKISKGALGTYVQPNCYKSSGCLLLPIPRRKLGGLL